MDLEKNEDEDDIILLDDGLDVPADARGRDQASESTWTHASATPGQAARAVR